MFGIESHCAPSALGKNGDAAPGPLAQAFAFRALGALRNVIVIHNTVGESNMARSEHDFPKAHASSLENRNQCRTQFLKTEPQTVATGNVCQNFSQNQMALSESPLLTLLNVNSYPPLPTANSRPLS